MEAINQTGVTFYLESHNLRTTPSGAFVGYAELTATVVDKDLWDQVVDHLHGMVLHRGKDFKTELIDVLRDKHSELEQKVEQEKTVLQGALEHARTSARHAEAAKIQASQRIRLLEAKVLHLQERLDAWEGPEV
jgi:polyhydroxyalkanoate synthesis regulator phasin